MRNDPVFEDPADGKFYFYDETWSDRGGGPYDTRDEANAAVERYAEWLERGDPDPAPTWHPVSPTESKP